MQCVEVGLSRTRIEHDLREYVTFKIILLEAN